MNKLLYSIQNVCRVHVNKTSAMCYIVLTCYLPHSRGTTLCRMANSTFNTTVVHQEIGPEVGVDSGRCCLSSFGVNHFQEATSNA